MASILNETRALVFETVGTAPQLRSLPEPEVDGGVLVDVDFGGICGTDLHLIEGRLPIPRPVVMGHEGVGRIASLASEATTDATGAALRVGDRVTWASNIPCGECYYCSYKHEVTLCPNRKIYGINQRADEWPRTSGSWSERMYLQPGSTIVRLPDDISSKAAIALGCAGPTVVHGLSRIDISISDHVVVQGSGPVGLAACMFARLKGARRITLIGGPKPRLQAARSLDIADAYIDVFETSEESRRAMVEEASDAGGGDVVIECTGSPQAVAEGFDLCRPGGSYLVLGQYTDHGAVPINPHFITKKQLEIHGSWAFGPSHFIDYAAALPALCSRYDLSSLVEVFPLSDLDRALAAVRDGECVKAALSG